MDVAREQFSRYGYKRTVIDDIVREVGIAKGTFYLYFKSKDQLLYELAHGLHHKVSGVFHEILARDTSVEARVRLVLKMSFQVFEDYPLMAKILAEDPEFRVVARLHQQGSLHEELDDVMREFRALLQTGIDNGELREDLDLETLPLALGMLKFLHYYTGLAAMHGVSRSEFVDSIVDLAVRGMLRH